MTDSRTENRDFLSHRFALVRDFAASLCPTARERDRGIGHGIAATVYLLVAILVNHIRRVLTPWMGQFMWHHAIENMKFARSSPHYFLEESLGRCSAWGVGEWACWCYAIEFVWRVVRGRVLGRERDVSSEKGEESGGRVEEMKMDVYRVVYLVVCLAAAERAYVETCWVAAHFYAYTRLILSPNAFDVLFLKSLLLQHRYQAILQCSLLLRWLRASFLPNMTASARTVPSFIAAGLFHYAVWGGTAYLVRYSNKYFLALQMSDMLVTFGWMVMAVVGFVVMELGEYLRRLRAVGQ
ncbi:hypothetical protein PT974_10750 [Cladobotryum mycophilum]|uniref:Wax synthase domain-containing protein n=1 Tax=Cladobotryum mycophilum TaxID=491253 RepID=A0ABR0SAS0_9HYPO